MSLTRTEMACGPGHRPATPGDHVGCCWTYRVEWSPQDTLLGAETRVITGSSKGLSAFICSTQKENTFRQNFSLVSSIFTNFRDFQVHSSFLISCHTIIYDKKQINMSISFSYLTTMAWEKFVEKYDDFMRNSKTKVKNEKTIKTMFSYKMPMVIFTGIWTFLLSLYPLMSLTLFFLFFSTTA